MVEDLKHNLLSVSKIRDQGYTLMFDSWKCEIREYDLGILVAMITRIPNDICVLYKEKRNKIKVTQKSSKDHHK